LETDKVVEAMEVLSKNHIEAAIFGSTLHITMAKAEEGMEKLAVLLRESGIELKRCEKIAPSLEDVFVTLIEAS
jgi:ABC-2 type transport system ATP-binding protein